MKIQVESFRISQVAFSVVGNEINVFQKSIVRDDMEKEADNKFKLFDFIGTKSKEEYRKLTQDLKAKVQRNI